LPKKVISDLNSLQKLAESMQYLLYSENPPKMLVVVKGEIVFIVVYFDMET